MEWATLVPLWRQLVVKSLVIAVLTGAVTCARSAWSGPALAGFMVACVQVVWRALEEGPVTPLIAALTVTGAALAVRKANSAQLIGGMLLGVGGLPQLCPIGTVGIRMLARCWGSEVAVGATLAGVSVLTTFDLIAAGFPPVHESLLRLPGVAWLLGCMAHPEVPRGLVLLGAPLLWGLSLAMPVPPIRRMDNAWHDLPVALGRWTGTIGLAAHTLRRRPR